jgi:sugar lactone lactonase YvrE
MTSSHPDRPGAAMLEPDDPRQVGEFTIVARLPAAGVGQQFLGIGADGRLITVTLINQELTDHTSFRERFRTAAGRMAGLSSPYLESLVQADPETSTPWLAHRHNDLPTLRAQVAEHGPLPVAPLLELAAGTAAALATIHNAGMAHGNLAPSTVLVNNGQPIVTGYGVAAAITDGGLPLAELLTEPGFMAPERAAEARASQACDVFSLGALLAFAATGREPFRGDTLAATLYKIMHAEPDLDGTPDTIRHLVNRCLAKNPVDRPVVDDLQRELPAAAPATPAPPTDASIETADVHRPLNTSAQTRPPRSARRWGLVIAVLGAIGIAAAVLVAIQPGGTARPAPIAAAPSIAPDLSPDPHPAATLAITRRMTITDVPGMVRHVTFSPDGKSLALANHSAVILYDVLSGRQIGETIIGESSVTFSPDRATLATSGRRGIVTLRDVNTARARVELDSGRPDAYIDDVAFSPDGQLVAFTDGRQLSLWDVATARKLGELPLTGTMGDSRLQFSADGQTLLASSQRTPSLIDVGGWQQRKVALPVNGPAALSPDGRTVVIAGFDIPRIEFYDATTGQKIRGLSGRVVSELAFSPDGKTVAAAGKDGAGLWDVTSGEFIERPYPTDFDDLESVAFNADGTTVAYGSTTGRVYLFDITITR